MAQLEPEQLLSQLEALKSNPLAAILENGLLRTQLRLATRDISILLERPADAIPCVMLSQPVESIVIRIAFGLDLFHILSTGRKTLEELAQITQADTVLLARLLRALAAFGATRESEGYDILSASYELFADSDFTRGISTCADFLGPAYLALPRHLASTHYQNPTDPNNTAVQDAFNIKNKDLFAILVEKPDTAQGFATLMSTWGEGNSLVQDFFPIGQFLADGESLGSATWVDVGGGYCQKTVALKTAFPELRGRFIVQDLPHVINDAVKKEGIEYLVHDFFTEQPIKGARAYYIRQVLHDFPDAQCITILTEIRKAMKPGYSKLFIHEQIVPDRGASVWAVTQDFNMCSLLGAAERTQEQFADIINRAGLRVVRLYSALDRVSEGVVEVDVME